MSKVKLIPTRAISEEEVNRMRLKGKPRCLFCHNPLSFVYEGSVGFVNEKCQDCKTNFLVNTETLEVTWIQKAI